MENSQKNYSCLAVIVFCIVGYVALSILFELTEWLGKLLENPVINYGIPVVILIVIWMGNRSDKKDE